MAAEQLTDFGIGLIPGERLLALGKVGGATNALDGLVGHDATRSAKATGETLKPVSLTTITDEMKANPYHPDWQRYSGNEPRAVGADVVSEGTKAVGEVVTPAPIAASGTTRTGVVHTNAADWRALCDNWDELGYDQILSTENRTAIAKGRVPKADDAWITVFPEDAGLKGKRIPMHHVQGSPLTVPLPDARHLDAHTPGGFRYNPGSPGSALPAYQPKTGVE